MRPPDHAVFVRVGVVLIALISSGCEQNGMGELRAYVREINSRPPGAVEPLPEIQPVDSFVFDPAGRRDPFVMDGPSKDAANSSNRLAPDPNRPKEQLEGFPLDALTMVGTLQQDDRRWALVQTKPLVQTEQGQVFRAGVGNYMGLNNGRILAIDTDSIKIMEIVSDAPGEWRERPITIRIGE
jgi:type IV pilus assembly protein PilP